MVIDERDREDGRERGRESVAGGGWRGDGEEEGESERGREVKGGRRGEGGFSCTTFVQLAI